MTLFNSDKSDKLKKLLQQSRTDFSFDQTGVKNRLQASIRANAYSPLEAPQQNVRSWNFGLAGVLAMIMIFVSTFAYADSTGPGDPLFFLDEFQERLALKMPRSQEARAQLRSSIVTERFLELDRLPADQTMKPAARIKALDRTQETIIDAVNETTKIKETLRQKGRDKSVEDMDSILNKLEKFAEEQEKQVEKYKTGNVNEDQTRNWDQRLEEIKKARQKARIEVKGDGLELKLENSTLPDPTNNR